MASVENDEEGKGVEMHLGESFASQRGSALVEMES